MLLTRGRAERAAAAPVVADPCIPEWNSSMSIATPPAARPDRFERASDSPPCDGAPAECERALRLAYFHEMGGAPPELLALGVGPERVRRHLAEAMPGARLRPAMIAALHMRDVALAAACVDARPSAWALLRQRDERALIRAGESFQTGRHAALRARRLLAETEDATVAGAPGGVNLRRYAGDAPLRAWLVERLMAGIARDLASRSGGQCSSEEGAAGRLESTLRLLRAESIRRRVVLRRAAGEDPRT